ncbi:MAG: SPOR domain-containing protein [Treponema sp.]|nr:SPOR domain-containing protein [Treponema sp.]
MYYIQIGAYRSSPSLDAAVSRLRDTFPVTVDTVQAGSGPVYRLFVGPLGRDETGVALLRVRSLGFKEAFLKN